MGVKIDFLSEGLDDGHHPGDEFCASEGLEVSDESLDSRLAELAKKPALVLEESAQHPGNDENDLTVRYIQKKLLPHPLTPFLQTFGMTGWAETTGSTGEVEKEF